jgi:caffeoyl-CoA O-methyltransferase
MFRLMSRLEGVQVTPELEDYVESLLPRREPVLRRIEEEVAASNIPGIGPAVGQLLALLVRMNGCRDVIELGTAIGYSAIWLGRACAGELVTLELDPERAERARRNLVEAGLGDRVRVLREDGVAYLEREERQVDCVFNDLLNSFPDEATVERCLELSLRRLSQGGLLLADNALRRGEVTAPSSRGARNVARYNELVAHEPRLESVIVPLRDGVSIARLR